METTSSLPQHILVLRWIARILGTTIVIFVFLLFIGEFLSKGYINVGHPGHYVLFVFFGIAQIGILIAWHSRWEGIGGLLTVTGIVTFDFLNIFWVQGPRMTNTIIASLIWLILAFIFLYCWWKTKRNL
jgi:hypothetical protein